MTSPSETAVSTPSVLTLVLGHESPATDLRRVRAGVARGVSSGRGVQLDLSAVDVLSSPTVATILWARRSCAARNLPFSVVGERGRTRRILRTCGLVDEGTGRRW